LTVGRALGASGFHLIGHLIFASATFPQAIQAVLRALPYLRRRPLCFDDLADGTLRVGFFSDKPLERGARVESELTAVIVHDVVLHFFTRHRSGADPGLLRQLLNLAMDQYGVANTVDDWTTRVRSALRGQSAPRLVDAEGLAKQLGVSARGLARRLAREGSSRSDLLEEALYERAQTMLMRPGATAHRWQRPWATRSSARSFVRFGAGREGSRPMLTGVATPRSVPL
jgi:AraC-like DNA-binding protein